MANKLDKVKRKLDDDCINFLKKLRKFFRVYKKLQKFRENLTNWEKIGKIKKKVYRK